MIYRFTHTTTYQYGGIVSLSHHILRLRPRELPRQRCLHNELLIEPRPDVLCAHNDYFGNAINFVTIEGSHKRLVITSRSQVEVNAPALMEPGTARRGKRRGTVPRMATVKGSCKSTNSFTPHH